MTPARRALFIALTTLAATQAVLAAAPATQPATVPATAPAGFEVREWVVLVVEAAQNRANGRGAFPATLPPFVSSRRASPNADAPLKPSPVGVIRLFGTLDPTSPVDVLLNFPGGEAEASWPRAQTKSGRLLWANLVPATADTLPAAVDAGHWFAALRGSDAVTIKSDTQAESLLAYDVSLGFSSPLRLSGDGDTLYATNGGTTPLLDLTLYKRANGHWTQATLDTLPGIVPTTAPTTAKADPTAAFDPPTTAPAARPAASLPDTRPASTEPATGPSTLPTTSPSTRPAAKPTGTAMTLAAAPANDTTTLLAPWRAKLLDAGVPGSDIDTVLSILAERGLDDRWLTAVYRVGPNELDRILPLEVVPAPRSVTRVGLVIVRGLDPAIAGEIDRLIARCGDPNYAVRKAATAALVTIGEPARGKLTQAQNNADAEIAQRAEGILTTIAKQKGN